jgi:hypothetical protein
MRCARWSQSGPGKLYPAYYDSGNQGSPAVMVAWVRRLLHWKKDASKGASRREDWEQRRCDEQRT